ncbi:circadian locomoter output cycles protein kaput [Caerostris extrusa]|uniref:Circadian locomoter output cycles protein kaput n=1 Tax=Caerostris extrusa TaxID=172846 RepID=A0AAV4VYB6_CAEEX|nr:circadian locomoter output cycles protein kaput [Caerostris extrusa]
MDYCDSRPIADDSMNGGTKDNLCLEENMSSLLSTALPYSDSNSHSASGWSDVFSPNEYPSPLSSEVLLEKDDQFLLNNPKVKSYISGDDN